jgi:hypothetical protein
LTSAIVIIVCKALKTKDTNLRLGLIYLASGVALSALFCGVFSMMLPAAGFYDLFWIGPLSVSITMLFTYFATLRYRLFVNTSSLLRFCTYLVVVATAAILYTCLFYLMFTLVFRGAAPSNEIIIFHFVMMTVVILILPSINHSIEYIKKMISNNGVVPRSKK